MSNLIKKLTLWRVLTPVLLLIGFYACFLRYFVGWRQATNMTDAQPWGVWVAVGTLCSIGLSAGGFALAAAVYIMRMERYRPILRAAVLISFLGYCSACVGYLYELGLPWRMWHVMIMWNKSSVLFEVAWCVMLYTTVLMLEFAPNVLEKLTYRGIGQKLLHWHHKILIGLVLIGVLLSSLHQSFLGGLFLLMKGRMHPLWYSPYIHTMFYMSAIPAGLALVIVALYLSVRSLGVRIDFNILTDMSRVIVPMLFLYGMFRAVNLINSDGVHYLFQPHVETLYFWLENLLLVIAPVVLYSTPSVRNNPERLYWTSCCVVAGFITHRVNVSITSMEASTHANYVPKWPEMAIMIMVFTIGILVFRYCVLHLNIFPRKLTQRWLATPASA
jgi:Ni/Fe-hydrogenase subunit HybB-like protein